MIIVTGANGFIGSNLVRRLIDQGKDVRGVDFEERNYNIDCIRFEASDFYNNLNNYCKDVEMIFHEGAISSTTETDEKKLFKYNTKCTMELMYFCRDNNIPLQYASSASVYGNMSIDQWHSPNKVMNPLNKYANSKKQGDYLAEMIITCKRPPRLLQGMRYFNVYGTNEDHKENQSSPHHKFKQQLLETGKIKLFEGSKEFLRDFISVDQVIDLKLKAFNTMPSGIYDVGTGTPKSFYDVAVEVGGSDEVIEWIPMPAELKEHYQSYSCAVMNWL